MVASKAQNQSKSKKIDASHFSPVNATAAPNTCCVFTQIRARAFQLFQKRGSKHGHDMQDWLRAERQVMAS
jgi:hypothetical protein